MQGPRPRLTAEGVQAVASIDYSPETVRWAVEVTLEELASAKQLEPIDAGVVQTVRVLASAVDVDSLNASLWRQFREALEVLTSVYRGGSFSDELEALMRGEVRDAPPAGPADPRSGAAPDR